MMKSIFIFMMILGSLRVFADSQVIDIRDLPTELVQARFEQALVSSGPVLRKKLYVKFNINVGVPIRDINLNKRIVDVEIIMIPFRGRSNGGRPAVYHLNSYKLDSKKLSKVILRIRGSIR